MVCTRETDAMITDDIGYAIRDGRVMVLDAPTSLRYGRDQEVRASIRCEAGILASAFGRPIGIQSDTGVCLATVHP
jgi:hypothetical protein